MSSHLNQVNNPLLREAYKQYSFNVIPRIGGLVANDAASYQYLVKQPGQSSLLVAPRLGSPASSNGIARCLVALHAQEESPSRSDRHELLPCHRQRVANALALALSPPSTLTTQVESIQRFPDQESFVRQHGAHGPPGTRPTWHTARLGGAVVETARAMSM